MVLYYLFNIQLSKCFDSDLHKKKAHDTEDTFSPNVLFLCSLYNPIHLSLFKALGLKPG